MTLHQLQNELKAWQAHNFPNRQSWEPLMGLSEEVGELSHAHLKQHQKIRLEENHIKNAKDAIGDILIYLADYCNARGFYLQNILNETWDEVKKRDWDKHRREND